MTDELDEILDKYSCDSDGGSEWTYDETRQAIQALIAKECNKARINELVIYDHAIRSGKSWITYIEDRLTELKEK
jgi:hypothetical protein